MMRITWLVAFTFAFAVSSGCGRAIPDTPLARASAIGDVSAVKQLLSDGEDPDELDGNGWSPLHWAARGGRAGVIHYLIEAGADVDIEAHFHTNWTPLLHAIHLDQEDVARVLIDNGADVNFRTGGGLTALIMAAGRGQTELVEDLLDEGANPYAEAKDGTNALWAAAGGGSIRDFTDGPPLGTCFPETIRVLREAVPDLGLEAGFNTSILRGVARSKQCAELIQSLSLRH
jgi:ankyrin repeat protein